MAVENKYIDSNINASGQVVHPLRALLSNGGELNVQYFSAAIAAADDDGSIYRITKDVDPNAVLLVAALGCSAITAGTDYDLGLYRPRLGAVISKDVFMDGQTFATAVRPFQGTGGISGLSNVAAGNLSKRIFEHAGHTVRTKLDSYDLALTANTVGTAAGTVDGILVWAQG